MTTDQNSSDKKSLRDTFANAPEWLSAVLEQLTADRDENRKLIGELNALMSRMNEREDHLLRIEEQLNNRSTVLDDKERSLLAAVSDLREFVNTIHGPGSKIFQMNAKLDGIASSLSADREANAKRFNELELAQEETDDHVKELVERLDAFAERLTEIERRQA